MSKKVEDDCEDPYIYTGGVVLRGTCRRRKLQDLQKEDQQKLESISASLGSRGRMISTRKLPPTDFGAQLFANLKGDSSSSEAAAEQFTRRRRAYTEMDDLLDDEIRLSEPLEKIDLCKVEVNNQARKHSHNSLPDVIKEK